MSYYALLVGVVLLCKTLNNEAAERNRPFRRQLIPHRIAWIQSPRQQIRVRIRNANVTADFYMDSDATAAELYQKADVIGMMNTNAVLLEHNGRIIRDDPSMKLLLILSPPSLKEMRTQRRLLLYPLAVDQIKITVVITNGDIAKSMVVNAGTRTNEVYEKALEIGILKNQYQSLLRCRSDRNRILENNCSPSSRPPTLLDYIDPTHPNKLNLIVTSIPEGMLLFKMFRDMAPNQNIPSWSWALFCNQNPWHNLCSYLSQRIQYEIGEQLGHKVASGLMSRENVEDWANEIHVVNVPTWSGVLHVQYLPRSVRVMHLKGHSVGVDLTSLRFSSLTELTLDFDTIIGGFNFETLSGSSLKVLRLPSYTGLKDGDVNNVLKTLAKMKRRGKIRLERIDFGHVRGEQSVIRYNARRRDYDYILRSGKRRVSH